MLCKSSTSLSARVSSNRQLRSCSRAQAVNDKQNPSLALVAMGAASLLALSPFEASAIQGPRSAPPVVESEGRCTVKTLKNFAETRAIFSQEASSGAMTEAVVDVRGCNFSNMDLTTEVMSGVNLQNADFSGSKFAGVQMARADARGANLSNADFTDMNGYATMFDGADLEGAQFDNAILSSASFGKFEGKWANLKGAHFEGALLSSSDIGRICENPTLDIETRKYELGCRGSR